MASRGAADDRPGRSTPCCALANGVSHEVRVETIKATPDVTKTIPLLITQNPFAH
jgi:hypothetical protein